MTVVGASAERPRLLLVGGNGSTVARFARVWPHLEAWFRPTVIEVAGQGERAGAPLPGTFAGFVDDLASELARAAAGERALCYGHGVGGLLLAHALRQAPEMAARLVLHAPVGAHLTRRLIPRLMRWAPAAALARSCLSAPVLGPVFTRRLFEPGGAVTRDDRRAFCAGYAKARSFASLFAVTDPLSALDGLDELTVPVTLLWGGRDSVLRPDQLPVWAETLRAAPVMARLVPHWRHYPYMDRPREFAAALGECFLGELPKEPVSLDALICFSPRTKAGRLASMRRAGLPVPSGWWVPPAALENGSSTSLFAALLPGSRYAVRSSAAGEDQAGQTAAGVYESELEVSPEELLEACRRVSRSGRSEYFQAMRNGRDVHSASVDASAAPACDVLVQEMAPRAAGGVALVRALGVDLEMAAGAFDRAVSGAAGVERASLSTLGPPWEQVPSDLPAGLTRRRLRAGLWPHLRRAHALFDAGTLDMEWCSDGRGRFRILQARPVGERHPARRMLTAANLREVAPPEPSPFLVGAMEALSPVLTRYYARIDPGIAAWHEPFTVTVAGRAYINADFYAALMDRWGLPRALVSRAIGGSVPGRGPRPDRLLAALPSLARMTADWTRLYAESGTTLARLRSELETARELPELAAWFLGAFQALIETMLRITSALPASLPLWRGQGVEVVTAVMAADLRAAAATGDQDGRAVFAARWGHRGEYESDPASPRGGEASLSPTPRPLLPDPLASLPRPIQRLPMLAPRHLLAHREWFKDGAMRLWAAFRARMLAAATELVRDDFLAAPEEVWHLTPAEILSLPVSCWQLVVRTRTGNRPDAVQAELFWSDTLAPLSPTEKGNVRRRSEDRLPLVPGKVRGPALVARTPSEALVVLSGLLAAGEMSRGGSGRPILLAPAVDPGWLPVLVQVGGVATELGGRLSHAATLLREMRIPSVLNLPGVTRTARSGELVELRVPPGEVRRILPS